MLQHTLKYHEARDWICLQDQITLTYQSLLAHCKQLKARCEQFQQAQAQGRAHLTTITAASSSHSSLHANTQSTTTCQQCSRCSYSHPHGTCPALNCECYNCHTTGYFTALCRRPHISRHPADTPNKKRESRSKPHKSSSHRHSSRLLSRGRQSCRSNSRNPGRNISSSCSPSQDCTMRRSLRCGRQSPTLYRHQVSHLISLNTTSQIKEGQLYTDRASDGHRLFHTMLQLITKQGCKSLPVKVDPGADVNTIPLSHYKTLFPKHFNKDGNLKQNTLRSTTCTWSLHDGHTQHFLGYFTIDIQHKMTPNVIPISLYIFEDSTRLFRLLSYPTSIHLGIMELKVPNEASSHTLVNSITNNPDVKQVSFSNPLHYSMTAKKTPTKKSA